MGKALYRKYRSSSLDEVIGQEHITNTLKNALKKGSISHAYLFTGPRGVGKTSVARILAHEVNGYTYDENVSQIDIIEIDAASNRRIDEIRELRDKVNIAPTSSKYKVYIIDEVHMLTREAFNALLKTLEEPPAHVIFILATTEAHKVPDTIISRTQRYSFKPIATTDAVDHLKMIAKRENLKISDDALKLIADHGSGSFRDSISMLDQIAGFDKESIDAREVSLLLGIPDTELLNILIESVYEADTTKLFDTISKLKEQGSSPINIAQGLINSLRITLNDKKSNLSSSELVNMMKLLMNCTGSNSSFENIEISLLESMSFHDEVKNMAPVKVPSKTPREESNPETVAAIRLDEKVSENREVDNNIKIEISALVQDQSSTQQNLNESDDKSWSSVLKLLKTRHNTLYGVLRMAETQIEDSKITLIFKFDFHKKQLQQNKNMDILHSVMLEGLGKKHDLELIVRKPEMTNTKKTTSDKDSTNLSSVSNIFGDAELLE